ncbi:MAG: hypothetical protein GEU97_24125 [Actinophytocola sp.]|nr:hypothetical protein [Actinophytocola sp.]
MTTGSDTPPEPWVTFDDAARQNPFTLARHWGDVDIWPLGKRTTTEALHEIATMAALADVLTRWLPLEAHKALLEGATAAEVATAAGTTIDELRQRWDTWVSGQLALWHDGADGERPRFGVAPEDAERVAEIFGQTE